MRERERHVQKEVIYYVALKNLQKYR